METNYRIIHADTLSELEREVSKLMEIGFIPIGGFRRLNESLYPDQKYRHKFYQTLYKPKSKQPIKY